MTTLGMDPSSAAPPRGPRAGLEDEADRSGVSDIAESNGAATGTASVSGRQSIRRRAAPHSLGEALHAAGVPLGGISGAGSETPSEEDYDENVRPALAVSSGLRHRPASQKEEPESTTRDSSAVQDGVSGRIRVDDEKALQDMLHSDRAKITISDSKRSSFGSFVFSKQFSTFDRNNAAAVNSPFHGFYNLFWLGVALFVFKISADNWRTYGNPLGSYDIVRTMFHRDVIVLLLSDGVMCALTGVTWALQSVVLRGYLDWDGWGWIIQHVWQITFMASIIGETHVRVWPWTHTVFFVLHGLVMLMKQHSYAFYNGYLSTVYKRRRLLQSKLKQLESVDASNSPSKTEPPVSTITTSHLTKPPSALQRRHSLEHVKTQDTDIDRISAAIASGQPLDDEQIHIFERILKWEIDALTDELKGTADDASKAYPNNLTLTEHYQWIPFPTVVYELAYPRSDSIDWSYVAEKVTAMVGILFVMIQISQYSIYPVVMKTVKMKEDDVPLAERFKEFPWLLSDLIFPFMMEYLLVWYLIWETILNILAELTYFADRNFYDAWWNCVSWDQFARDWNRPVHVFLLRHVYHSTISSLKVNKHTATLITFFLSACAHELIMWCLFNKLRGYLLILQMCQLPLVRLSRTRWLKGQKTLGNLVFWLGIFTGPSLLCSLYLIL